MAVRDPLHAHLPFLPPPLPGTDLPPRALFVGRWGALLKRVDHPPSRFDPALFSDGALSVLFRAQQAGWILYLVGNEDAVARGRMSDAHWQRFEESLLAHLKAQGITIARNYACLDHPQGKGQHQRDSVFLFPNTGALYHAAQEDGIELASSWLIGDDVKELAAGWRAGTHVAAIAASRQTQKSELEVEAALRAPDLARVLCELLAADHCARR